MTRLAHYMMTFAACAFLSACSTVPPIDPGHGHLHAQPAPPAGDIPQPVAVSPAVLPPQVTPPLETYTVVVSEVPVKELLFSLAREAKLNVDIHPGISGSVTLNAIDQTLPQILDRISKQVDLRYRFDGRTLLISQDVPYLHAYKVDYVNMSRDSSSTVSVATQIATTGSAAGTGGASTGGAGGSNNSQTQVANVANNRFWETLEANIRAILGEVAAAGSANANVIVNRESGLINVRATQRQHEDIQNLLDRVLDSARRQVLIEATIVEVELNKTHEAGVDWQHLTRNRGTGTGLNLLQSLTGSNLNTAPFFSLGYLELGGDVSATIRLLQQFGDVKVLSSPKIMALNNQTAMLKVVDNKVYFTVEVQTSTTSGVVSTTYETTVNTVPVGFVMNVTPQINDSNTVTLNLRPSISRIIGFVRDPNPALAQLKVISEVPEIQVRKMESMLKIDSGQTAVMGGLMQDTVDRNTSGVPLLADLPWVGELFKYRKDQNKKTELVIFLKPMVVRNASLDADLSAFRRFLPGADQTASPAPAPAPVAEAQP